MQISSNETLDRKSEHGLPQISEPRLADPGEFLLLREMTHRINNELTSAISLASVMTTRSDSCDVKIALASMIEHLYDHARVYRALQMPMDNRWIDATARLRELCESISRAKLRHNGIELVLVEYPIRLTSMQCWRLSGQGLKIVQQLALALNGDIDLRFGENGAIATVSFPIAKPI